MIELERELVLLILEQLSSRPYRETNDLIVEIAKAVIKYDDEHPVKENRIILGDENA